MNLLPVEHIIFKSTLSVEDIIMRLNDIIEDEKTLQFSLHRASPTKPYHGQITGNQFFIERNIQYRNSFVPKISGTIQKEMNGSTIHIKMQLNRFVVVFLMLWCSVVGVAFITFVIDSINKNAFDPGILVSFIMFVFAYALTMGGFNFESNQSKKDLSKIFDGQIVAKH